MAEPQQPPSTDTAQISIVVPSFNQAEFLPRMLDSILGQHYPNIEIIIADGGSTDGSVAILERYALEYPQLQWLSEPDNGPADAVNKGLIRASGEYIGIQSSDDIYYSDAFALVASTFAANPDCGFICGAVEGIDESDYILYRRDIPGLSWDALFAVSMSIPQSSIFFRADIARAAGLWNAQYYGCDLDYWMRLLFRTQGKVVSQVLSGWRRYAGQRTRPDQFRRIWDDYRRMIETSPDIAKAPKRIQRLARASKHLLVLRTPPSDAFLVKLRHLAIGAALHPGFWRYNDIRMILQIFPGYASLQKSYQSIRQKLGLNRPARKPDALKLKD